jgi:hypothetical protein
MHVSKKKNLLQQWIIFQEMKVNPNSCYYQQVGTSMIAEAMLSLNDLRETNVPCDAVLRLEDGGVFLVHTPILSECSTYFRFVWLLLWLINVRSWDIIGLQNIADVN